VPQLEVEVNLAAAQRYGIKPGDVRRASATMVAGEEVGDLFRGGKAYDVQVWSTPASRQSVSDIENMLIDTPSGDRVRIADLATVRIRPTANIVQHDGGVRFIDVGANIGGRDLGAIANEVNAKLAKVSFARSYHAELLGEYKERQAAQRSLLIFAIGAAVVILLLLQVSYASWRLAWLSFFTLPSALVGGLLAVFWTGRVVSLGSLVGFLTVLGIAARNGILLISRYQHLERYEGATFGWDLVLRGSRDRLSPILMTTLATGLALVPLVILGDIPGHEIEYPMAIVILGGLLTSTLINLFVVPALYLRFGRRRARMIGTGAVPA
jgi:Cu/Ag efflux pump CusA